MLSGFFSNEVTDKMFRDGDQFINQYTTLYQLLKAGAHITFPNGVQVEGIEDGDKLRIRSADMPEGEWGRWFLLPDDVDDAIYEYFPEV